MSDILVDAVDSLWGNSTAEKSPKQSIIITSPDDTENDLLENTIDKKIKKEKHRELVLKNDKEENNLIPKNMINAVLGEIQHSIHTNFVDFPRREAPTIAARMEAPEKERDLEKMLQEKIRVSLNAVKSTITKLLDDGIYE